MFDHRMAQFEQLITIIHPGEFLATGDDIIISTVLGSCVAVVLRDEKAGFGGLNHFMLPENFDRGDHFVSRSAKYGMYAMELLINDLLKAGCRRDRLTAKVFGGGSLLGKGPDRMNKVPRSNIEFAFDYLKTERIPVASSDVGGTAARKILFFVRSGKVLLKRITGTFIVAVEREESDYLSRIRERESREGEIVLF